MNELNWINYELTLIRGKALFELSVIPVVFCCSALALLFAWVDIDELLFDMDDDGLECRWTNVADFLPFSVYKLVEDGLGFKLDDGFVLIFKLLNDFNPSAGLFLDTDVFK